MLAVLGGGVFLAGLELFVTAVALPSIVIHFGDGDWRVLREASWIIDGYLVVSVLAMPIAGRLVDSWGARRLFLLALGLFTAGSVAAGAAQTLEQLIAARLVQGLGGGALVPIATAAGAHLFGDRGRPRALGVVGGLTFLGMAAGPFVGAAILDGLHPASTLDAAGVAGPLRNVLDGAWRFVFYVNVPIGLAGMAIAWAATAGWDTPRRRGSIDGLGAATFTVGLAGGLAAISLVGAGGGGPLGVPLPAITLALGAGGVALLVAATVRGARVPDPFLDPRLFRSPVFSSAALVALLTGYAFATAIVGGAVFVDRVLYGGADTQRIVLGSLAAATAVGALASGLVLRLVGPRLLTVAGLAACALALVGMAAWTPSTSVGEAAALLGLFGLGFGLTVTPRSTAAVEAAGRAAFGVASSTVTVARYVGMAIGLAVLTAYGSTTIDRLTARIYATPDAYRALIPAALRGRSLRDGLVVQALEQWASGEAARIMVGIFLVAAGVSVGALLPALAMRARPNPAGEVSSAAGTGETEAHDEDVRPTLAL